MSDSKPREPSFDIVVENIAEFTEMVPFDEIAEGLGVTAQPVVSKPQQGSSRGGRRGRGDGGGRARGGRGRSLAQAGSVISALAQKAPPALPSEESVTARQMDEMSAKSESFELALEVERSSRLTLEEEFKKLKLSHSQLATQVVALIQTIKDIKEGKGKLGGTTTTRPSTGGTPTVVLASTVVSSRESETVTISEENKEDTKPARGGLARRRGGR